MSHQGLPATERALQKVQKNRNKELSLLTPSEVRAGASTEGKLPSQAANERFQPASYLPNFCLCNPVAVKAGLQIQNRL